MTYKIQKGDTLYGISNQFGVSVSDILKINDVNPNNLQIGTIINIPSKSNTNTPTFTYKVVKGDSLYSIAKKYDTTVNKLIDLNNLKTNNLSIGQTLEVPNTSTTNKPEVFINYKVKSGDTLYSIARKYNTTVDVIKKDNGMTSNILTLNQNLKIRTNDSDVLECINENVTDTITYKVVKGDNLYSIAKKFNTSVDAIKKKNYLTSNLLSIGQTLKI